MPTATCCFSSSFILHLPPWPCKLSPAFTSQTQTQRLLLHHPILSSMAPDSNNNKKNKRRKYGSSRKSVLRKTLKQEQVNFNGLISDDPVVAIIGGGMSGLLCALQLQKRGLRSTVFDTGIHGLGGRMGTRMIEPSMIFDHAAQFFTVSNPLFSELVDEWSQKGFVRQSLGVIGELEAGGDFSPFPSSPPRYIAINGMRSLADSLLSQENIPSATAEKVKELMLAGVETALGLPIASLKRPMYTRVQLWGAALPTNTPGIPCIFDPLGRAGICGDWLLGSSLEAAALSGISLANHTADYLKSGGSRPDEFAVGLHNDFQPLEGYDIGQFPGIESNKDICDVKVQLGS